MAEPTTKRSRQSSEQEDDDNYRTIVLDMTKYGEWVRKLTDDQLVSVFEIGLKIRESATLTVNVNESLMKKELSSEVEPVKDILEGIKSGMDDQVEKINKKVKEAIKPSIDECKKQLQELSSSLKKSPNVKGSVGEKLVMTVLKQYFSSFSVDDVSSKPGKGDIMITTPQEHRIMIEVKNRERANVPQSEIDRFKTNLKSSPDVRVGILFSLRSGITHKGSNGKFQVVFNENQYQIYVPNAVEDETRIIWSVLMAVELAQSVHGGDLGTSQVQSLEKLYNEFQETKDRENVCRNNLESIERAAITLRESMTVILGSIDKTRKKLKKLIEATVTAQGKPTAAVVS